MDPELDRAIGALRGLALGDALGMPTQTLSPAEIRERYGSIDGLVDATADQPIAAGMPRGSVTDDTEQAMLVARLIVEGRGHIDPRCLADELMRWEDSMRARGSLDLLGPSTRGAIEELRRGAPIGSTGVKGTTNGAAMRIAPVGIANRLADPQAFLDRVTEACVLSHNTVPGIESAAIVAAAVSAGVSGASPREAVSRALDTVAGLPAAGRWTPQASVVARTRYAVTSSAGLSSSTFVAHIRRDIGTSLESTESVPAAVALAWHYHEEPFEGLLAAAAIGGDTDTIGAIAGAILGAGIGRRAFPAAQVETVERVSALSLEDAARDLLALRAGAARREDA